MEELQSLDTDETIDDPSEDELNMSDTERSLSTTLTGIKAIDVKEDTEKRPEARRFLNRKKRPTDSHLRLKAFLDSPEARRWRQQNNIGV